MKNLIAKGIKHLASYVWSWLFLFLVLMCVPDHLIDNIGNVGERRIILSVYLFGGAACLSPWLTKVCTNIKTIILKQKEDEKFRLLLKVREHHSTLRRGLEFAVKKNDYGAIVIDQRQAVIKEFLDSTGHRTQAFTPDETISLIYKTVHDLNLALQEVGFNPDSVPEDGLAFEWWIADNLSKFGWVTETTKGSGDQGVDVIAKKSGVIVGLQCKRYNSSVGNKAVQEIIAAKIHFNLDKAAVITNSRVYTKSAQELAASSGVKLLSHHDIPNFDAIFLN